MKHLNLVVMLLSVCSVCISFNCQAQKQPQIQESSLWAPANMKVDGKLPEWPNLQLPANNSANRIQYAVTNDDNNLYLTILGGGANASRKILSGGMIFTISHETDKRKRQKDKNNIVVTFPIPMSENVTNDIMGTVNSLNPYVKDINTNHLIIDSIVTNANKKASAEIKEIKIAGIKEISDSVISIYNENGIKAAMQFIRRMPVIEIAIPLKYLGLNPGDVTKIAYSIKLNGEPDDDISNALNAGYKVMPDDLYMVSTSDLWGEYALAKRP